MECVRVFSLLAVALSTSLCATTASAQAIISGTYYEERKSVQCSAPGNSSCALIFAATPQMVLFTDVSCLIQVNGPIAQTGFGVNDAPTPGALRRIEFFPVQPGNGGYYTAKFKTSFLFGAGKYPTIYWNLTTVGTGQLDCKIVGTLQAP
jgi:hypothetical protein